MDECKIQKQLSSNIWKFYLYQACSGMYFSVPIMVLFWQDNGLSLTKIMILQSIFSVATVILEIPSGYFSDVHGRKFTLLIASVAAFLGICAYSIAESFEHFLCIELLFALSVSFSSGTTSAFVFDTLLNLKIEEQFKEIWGNAIFYKLLALALANILGGVIATYDLRYSIYASIPFFAAMVPLVLSMREPKRDSLIVKQHYLKEIIHVLNVSLMQNRKLRWLIIYSGIVYAFNQSVLWLYQPYFKLSGLDIIYFGVVFASFQLVAAFSSKFAFKIEAIIGEKKSLAILILLVAISYCLMGYFIFLFGFIFCFIQQFVRGFRKAVVSDYLNKLVDSDMRATVLSSENFVGSLLYAIIIPIFGWISDIYSLQQALVIMGIITFVVGSFALVCLKKNKLI
ncbi:MAG: MFS transporter [Candidatus Cloacimonetes bacterium]|nr:MFS transporter [Candidatus Cloacimonadota bacterium]